MIMITCIECQSESNEFNTKLGELVCLDCGLVLMEEPFEEGSYTHDGNSVRVREGWSKSLHEMGLQTIQNKKLSYGSIQSRAIFKGVSFCRMLMANLKLPKKAFYGEVEELYIRLYKKNVFSTYRLEDRAAALVYYMLRNRNLPFTLKEVAKEYSCDMKTVYVIAKKVAKSECNTGVFVLKECRPFAEKYAMILSDDAKFAGKVSLVATRFDNLISRSDDNTRPSTPAAYCSITATLEKTEITNKRIEQVSSIGYDAIGREVKRLLKMINTNKKEIEGKGIECLEKY